MVAFSSLNGLGNEGLRPALAQVTGPVPVGGLPLLEHALPRAQFARRRSTWLTTVDGRLPARPDAGLAFARFTAAHPPSADEKVAFTMVQAHQDLAPPAFRFRFLDDLLSNDPDP